VTATLDSTEPGGRVIRGQFGSTCQGYKGQDTTVTELEEPLYRAAAIAGSIAAQSARPAESVGAKYAVGMRRRACAEVRRRARAGAAADPRVSLPC
jgi:hypothetical protein